MSIEAKFNAAVSVIRNLPKNGSYQPSNELMLRFYSYFKQATEGPVKGPRPGFWDVVKRAKWDAWARLGNMPQEEAMQRYVDELNKIVETMAFTDNVADFLTSLDSFSRQVPMEDLEMCIGPTLEKVRSQPGSPLSGTPFGSRDASPTRNSVASIEPVNDLDEEDEDFLDSMEQAEPESRVKPESVKKIHHVNGSSGFTKDVRMVNGYLEPRKNMDTAVTEGLQKAVESLRRDLTQTNYKLMTLEHHLENINKRAQLFGCLSKEAVIFIAVWPIVVHFLLRRIMRRSE